MRASLGLGQRANQSLHIYHRINKVYAQLATWSIGHIGLIVGIYMR